MTERFDHTMVQGSRARRVKWERYFLFLFFLTFSGWAYGQTASITGVVTDADGAVIRKASVAVRDPDTGVTRAAETSEAGVYTLPNLPVGSYEVWVQSLGFKTVRIKVEVSVAEIRTLNVRLPVGSADTTVDVKGESANAVELDTAQLSNVVGEDRISRLPMLTRDPYALILLSPGAIETTNINGGYAVNGSRDRNNNFLLDGTDNNDTSVPGIAGGIASLNPEATQEFRVITNSFNPEYGRNTGAIINVVTKSGTNDFHGDAHWFGRYNALGARDWFNKAEGDSASPQDPYVRNIFGFDVGGPIKKDRTFFFIANEFARFRTTLTNSAYVPTPEFKTGKFTTLDANGNPVAVDLSNVASLTNPQGMTVDPAIQKVLAAYPNPNAGVAIPGMLGVYDFPTKSAYDSYNLTAKLDHQFRRNHRLSLRYAYGRYDDPDGFHDDNLPGIGSVATTGRSHSLSAAYTKVIDTNLVNELRASANRNDSGFYCNGTNTINALTGGRDLALPGMAEFACTQLGYSNGQFRRTGTYSLADSLSWIKGNHAFKYGAEFRFIFEDGYSAFSSREYDTFNVFSSYGAPALANELGETTDAGQNSLFTTTQQNMAWALLGVVDSQNQAEYFNKNGQRTQVDNRKFRQREYGFFLQDAWKIRPNFTLTYGLRYQFNGVPYEANGNLSNLYTSAEGNAPLTFQLAGPGNGRLLYHNDFSMAEPRLGFAWDPFSQGKTAIRGSFGIFHDRIFGNVFGNARGNPPFEQDYYNAPLVAFSELSSIPTLPASATVQDGALIYPVLVDPGLKMPRALSWSFGLQHELPGSLTLNLNYVGSRGDRLLKTVDGNAPDPALVKALLADGVPESVLQRGTLYYGHEYGYSYNGDTAYLPFDAVHNNAFLHAALITSQGTSNYNALQLSVTKHLAHGLQIQGAYTWSHSLDNSADPIVPGTANGSVYPRDSHNLQLDYGASDFDIRHNLVIDYTWELPIGKGKAYLSRGAAGRILEGWSLSGITSWRTGLPYNIFGTRDSLHAGRNNFAYLVGDPSVAHRTSDQTGANVAAFGDAPWGMPSNFGRNYFRGPHYSNFDMVLGKTVRIGDRCRLETRFEGYNIFNHPQFGQPENDLTTDTFGYSLTTLSRSDGTTSARQLQFGMKLLF